MSDRTKAKLKAKQLIQGSIIALWFTTVLVGVPVSIVSGINGSANTIMTTFFNVPENGLLMYAVDVVFSILVLAVTILTIPLHVGLAGKFLFVARGGSRKDKSVWEPYRNKDIAEPIKGNLLAGLYIFLWSLLFVIPGIVAAMRYSMLNFVFADNPGIDYRSAMEKCKQITKRRKGKIFGFYLSFLGWDILVGLTCGILSIYVVPYEQTAFAVLYDMWNPKVETVEPEEKIDEMRSSFPVFDYQLNHDDHRIYY